MIIPGGYYLKARKIQGSAIAHAAPYVREIWDWLLKEANHKDNRYRGFTIKRGQLFRSYRDIREGLHWMVGYRKMMYNENQAKKGMKFLRERRMIDTTKELGGVLITILNYNTYQDPKNYESANGETNDRTNEEPMENHPLPDNNKNDKNVKNEKNNKDEFKFLKKVSIPDNIFLTDNMKNYVLCQGGKNGSAEEIFEDFKNWHGAKGSEHKNWTMAFQKWVRKDKEYHPEKYIILTPTGFPG